jgi:hypothetical protein
MYNAELMMAVVIACTTFIGLTGIVIGQISTSKYTFHKLKFCKYVLSASLLIGIVVFFVTIEWFERQETVWKTLSSYLFGAQIGSFIFASFILWGVIK